MGRMPAALATVIAVASLTACSAWMQEDRKPEHTTSVRRADAKPATHVVITISQGWIGHPQKPPSIESLTLECGPAAGKALNPSACRRLSRQGPRLFATKPFTCILVRWVRAAPILRVEGRVRGRRVHLLIDGGDCVPPAFLAWTRVAAWP
jgi:hypothetical protein